MRVLIITDSLGCPRKEIDVSKTWTELLLEKWSASNIVFYTQCSHGLSTKKIDLNYIRELSPDIIILQVGIVDACRRALPKVEFHLFSRIPHLNKAVKNFCSRHHFLLTRIRNIHDCSTKDFECIVHTIEELPGNLYFVRIAPPGKDLIKKVYHVIDDVDSYNMMVKKRISEERWVDPYLDYNKDDYLLEDGHHLTEYGHILVYESINKIIEREVGKI